MSEIFAYWDTKQSFSPVEVAFLINGIDPSSDLAKKEGLPEDTYNLMERAFESAHAYYSECIIGRVESAREPLIFELLSDEFRRLVEGYLGIFPIEHQPIPGISSLDFDNVLRKIDYLRPLRSEEINLSKWLSSFGSSIFPRQKLSRRVMHKWLVDNNIGSVYKFIKNAPMALGIRDDELRIPQKQKPPEPKPLTTNEKNTLLTLIAVLGDYAGLDVNARGAAKNISKLTEEFGAPITDDTIIKVLKAIPLALESRMK